MYTIKLYVLGGGIEKDIAISQKSLFEILEDKYEIFTLEDLKDVICANQLTISIADLDDNGKLIDEINITDDELLEMALNNLPEFREEREAEKKLEFIKSKMKDQHGFQNDLLDKYNSNEINQTELHAMMSISKAMGGLGKMMILGDNLEELMKEFDNKEQENENE
ncbi:MAG TPA: hypothetical protein VMX17_06705 [Candidatus Glassbacteria bacterium]|nr:hypothetical protein [Candidatus Glassbacteria bacterium]